MVVILIPPDLPLVAPPTALIETLQTSLCAHVCPRQIPSSIDYPRLVFISQIEIIKVGQRKSEEYKIGKG